MFSFFEAHPRGDVLIYCNYSGRGCRIILDAMFSFFEALSRGDILIHYYSGGIPEAMFSFFEGHRRGDVLIYFWHWRGIEIIGEFLLNNNPIATHI